MFPGLVTELETAQFELAEVVRVGKITAQRPSLQTSKYVNKVSLSVSSPDSFFLRIQESGETSLCSFLRMACSLALGACDCSLLDSVVDVVSC